DGTIKIGAGKVAGIPVKSFQGKIAGTGGLIEVQEAAVLLPGLGFANAFGTIENGNLNLTLEGEQIETALLPVAVLQEQQVSGTLSFHGTVGGKLTDPAAALSFTVSNLLAKGTAYGDAWGNLQAAKKEIIIDEAVIKDNTGSHFLTGSVALNTAAPELNLKVTTNGVRAETIAALAAPGLTGFLTQETTVSGPLDNLNAKGWLQLTEGSYDGYLIEEATSDYEYKDKTFYVDTLTIHSLGSKTTARGSLGPNGELDFSLQAREINLARMPFNYPYPVTGWINIAGQVSGNIADPVLTGKMNASRIRANGQILTGLTGSFNYQNAVATITDLSVAHGAGQVRFTGTANVKTTDLNGSLAAENVRIPGLLTLLKQPALDIDGYLNGTISVNGKFEKPALVLRGEIKGGRVKQYDLGTIALNASFINDVIRIRSLSAEQAGGFLTAQGHADLNGDIEMEINGENLNAGLFTALADSTFDPPGKVNFTAAASGPLKNPDANISLEIKNDLAENAAFDLIRGLFTLHDGVVKIDDLLIEKGIYKAVATGTLPLKALNVTGRKRADAADTMDISIKLDNADLSILPLLFPEITAASGDVAGYLDIKGTLAQPDVNGRINVAEGQGTVKLASLADPIEKIGVDIIFKNDTISIDKFDGEIRGGSYQLNGTAKVRGLGLSDYNLYFLANKLRVRHKYFDGALDAEFALTSTGRGGRPLLAGSVYTENSTIDVPGLPEERSGGFDIELDVDLNIGKKVRVYNPYLFDLLIDGKVNVGGTLERMMLLGHIESRKGSITYLSTRFNVVNATADFARHQGLVPNINLATRARAGRTFIMLDANGAADNLKIKLTSDPPMSDENIMKLLTLGYNASTAQTSSEAPASNFWLTGLQVQAAARVESLLRRNLGIDEFRVEPASMFEYRNRKATNHSHSEYYGYNLRVGKYLRDDLMVSYSTALDQASSSVIVQYDLNRRVSVSGTFGGLNSGLYTIEGRFRF
ncbi:MAG: translocation/assembly module TamB domain-containing protein, partial [Sporomusaceae bacterium]|nr:translocation/assembly module TamB domain-containing protein [Sporomusaceae bacterium]